MRILIAALHAGYYRNLEPVVEALADRGHEIFLGTERKESAGGGQSIVDRLAEGRPNVRVGVVPRGQRMMFGLPNAAMYSAAEMNSLTGPMWMLRFSSTAVGRWATARPIARRLKS